MVSTALAVFSTKTKLLLPLSCLAYYNVNAPVVRQVHAPVSFITADQILPDNTLDNYFLQPMAYRSKSLTPTGKRDAQIPRNVLAIKLEQRLRGKSDATVHTDHQPLQFIFHRDLAASPKHILRDNAVPTTLQLVHNTYCQVEFNITKG